MYKSKLQEFCQRHSWELSKYAAVKHGPDHMPQFTATVNVHGELFTTPGFCKSSKDAQNTAARVAFEHLTVTLVPSPQPPPSLPLGLYKNLLHEFVQKMGDMHPSYKTWTSGLGHDPIFVSTVKIGSHSFQGGEAKTKKQAEMDPAKIAYCALTKAERDSRPLA